MSDLAIVDSPTKRTRYEQLTPFAQEVLLDNIRERRLAALRVYEELLAKKAEAKEEKLAVKAGKLAVRIAKKLETAEKAIEAVETMMRDAKAMTLELTA